MTVRLHIVVWTIAVCRRFQNTLKREVCTKKAGLPLLLALEDGLVKKKVVVKQFDKHSE